MRDSRRRTISAARSWSRVVSRQAATSTVSDSSISCKYSAVAATRACAQHVGEVGDDELGVVGSQDNGRRREVGVELPRRAVVEHRVGAVAVESLERLPLGVLEVSSGIGGPRVRCPGSHRLRRSLRRVELPYSLHETMRHPAQQLGQLHLPHRASQEWLHHELVCQPRVVRFKDGVVGGCHLDAGVSEQDLGAIHGTAVEAYDDRCSRHRLPARHGLDPPDVALANGRGASGALLRADMVSDDPLDGLETHERHPIRWVVMAPSSREAVPPILTPR